MHWSPSNIFQLDIGLPTSPHFVGKEEVSAEGYQDSYDVDAEPNIFDHFFHFIYQ